MISAASKPLAPGQSLLTFSVTENLIDEDHLCDTKIIRTTLVQKRN